MSNIGLQFGSSAIGMASSALNVTAPLTKGVYALWSSPLTAYIGVGAPPSTSIAGSSNGYPVTSTPVQLNIGEGFQIAAVSTGVNVVTYQRIG